MLGLVLLWVATQCAQAASVVRSASDIHATSFPLDLLPSVTKPQIEPTPPLPPDVFLVIGIKSRVLRGADARRAIRETWASPASTTALGVRVVFLGCEPDLSVLADAEKTAAQDSIATEKTTYHDFWTDELQCIDSFFTLVDKTVAFLDVALRTWPTLQYTMITDDDVYIRLDDLVELLRSDRIPNKRFYGGNVGDQKQLRPTEPIRNPESRYYLPWDMYPISELPPFVAGAQYVLSKDMVGFVARNRRHLRGLRGLDDATMAIWMLAMQVRPMFLPEFQILRTWNCTENLISYADLASTTIRTIHDNVVNNRAFCTGFEYMHWFKEYATIYFDNLDDPVDSDDNGDVHFHWDLELDPVSRRLQIPTTITIANQSIALLYVPALATYSEGFCNQVLPLLEAKLSILVGTNFCRLHRKILMNFLKDHDGSPLRPWLTLARHILERDAIDDAANNPKKSVLHVRVVENPADNPYVFVLVECLISSVYPDQHIVVTNDRDESQQTAVPSIVVFDLSLEADTDSLNILRRFPDPHTTFLVLSIDGTSLKGPIDDPRMVMISSNIVNSLPRHLYLPRLSVVLAGATRYSPLDLLHPVENQPQSFCAVWLSCGGNEQEEAMVKLLSMTQAVETIDRCNSTTSTRSTTPIDDTIDLFRRYAFVVVFDTQPTAAGFVSEGIAMTFLAGAIPIYLGETDTASRLFNPNAFVDCSQFSSLEECAQDVHTIHRSSTRYHQMKNEAPVVNRTVFIESFSWHPTVAEMPAQDNNASLLGTRLKQLLGRDQGYPINS